ncbi:MAG: hypothetical protein AB7K86_08390 [Rhodospirillales bacterium]
MKRPAPCWTCAHFGAWLNNGSSVECRDPRLIDTTPLGCLVQASPAAGCDYHVREPGSDDEPITSERVSFSDWQRRQRERS